MKVIKIGILVLCLCVVSMPYDVRCEGSMNLITVNSHGDSYELYFGNVMFSKGTGVISDIQCEIVGTEIFVTYTAETPRFAWSPDGEGFIDMETPEDAKGTPKEVAEQLMVQHPDLFLVTLGNNGGVGGKTRDLEIAKTIYGKHAKGSRKYSQCEFRYCVWYMEGGGYDGNWVATMETWDHDWWNKGSTDFCNVYIWRDYREVKSPPFGRRSLPKLHYTRFPFFYDEWKFNGYCGYFKEDKTSSYGWYYESGRNTQGDWNYYLYSPWKSYAKECWYADNTGSNFCNTQTVAVRRMENPKSLTLTFYIEVIGFWSGRKGFSWAVELYLQNPAQVGA